MTVPGSLYTPTIRKTRSGYSIDQSIRFNTPDSAYMYRTPGTTGDRKTWTYSLWIKRSGLTINNRLFSTGGIPNTGNANMVDLYFSGATLNAFMYNGVTYANVVTTAQFRDPSAWYHVVYVVDTTQATSTDRIKIYVNSVQQITTGSFPTLNYDTHANQSGVLNAIGRYLGNGGVPDFDGYLSEAHMIDGQALAPTDFGETNADGVWVPKAYEGTYGTNGFYITGEDSAALGTDYSGNGNNFTSSGLTTDDQVTDTPTDNYSTANPLSQLGTSPTGSTFSDGNLTIALNTGSNHPGFRSTIAVDASDDTYMETTYNTHTGAGLEIGIVSPNVWASSGYVSSINSSYSGYAYGYRNDGQKMADGSSSAYGDSFTAGDVIGMRLNAGSLYFYKNGTIQNSGTALKTGLTGTWNFGASHRNNTGGTENITLNFGQSTFGNLPTGSAGWSTANLPASAIKDGSKYFQTTLYTGTGATLEVNQTGNSTFQPDFGWLKRRNSTGGHNLVDVVRGVGNELYTNSTSAETSYGRVQSFDADGFTLPNTIFGDTNESGGTFVAWQWLANGSGSSNTDGATSSTVSANQTAGFSVVTYTGTGSATTIGHGLGVVPQFIAIKGRTGGADSWGVYPGTSTGYGGQYRLKLNEQSSVAASSVYWNNTDATSSVFTVTGGSGQVGESGVNYVAYCWAEVAGYSKIGRYTGNGSADGPFVWCGFRPAFVTIKYASGVDSWYMWDTQRSPYNQMDNRLVADLTAAEVADRDIDFVSNGFKIREANSAHNASGDTYIFMAFAENPFGGAGVAPATAR